MTKQIILDMVLEQTRNAQNRICVQGEARETLAKYGLSSNVLNENGPAGGNPQVRLIGPQHSIEGYIRNEYANDEEDALFYIEMITPYTGAAEPATHTHFSKAERQRRHA